MLEIQFPSTEVLYAYKYKLYTMICNSFLGCWTGDHTEGRRALTFTVGPEDMLFAALAQPEADY